MSNGPISYSRTSRYVVPAIHSKYTSDSSYREVVRVGGCRLSRPTPKMPFDMPTAEPRAALRADRRLAPFLKSDFRLHLRWPHGPGIVRPCGRSYFSRSLGRSAAHEKCCCLIWGVGVVCAVFQTRGTCRRRSEQGLEKGREKCRQAQGCSTAARDVDSALLLEELEKQADERRRVGARGAECAGAARWREF